MWASGTNQRSGARQFVITLLMTLTLLSALLSSWSSTLVSAGEGTLTPRVYLSFVVKSQLPRLLFSSSIGMYSINSNGAEPTKIRDDGEDPVWSPDRSRIAFAWITTSYPNFDIYIINADGSAMFQVTTNPGADLHPTWSPDGQRLGFYSERKGNMDIYTINVDGSGEARLTTTPLCDTDPSWSPDGTKILFHTCLANQTTAIDTIKPDGSGRTRLAIDESSTDPAWSPDGTKITFALYQKQSYYDIYTMNADGSGRVRLTSDSLAERDPAWSPDGQQIAFVREGVDEVTDQIYIINIDGSGEYRLTNDWATYHEAPSWEPRLQP